jgi:predicted nucleic acid-binding Zn ribbon protein
MPWRDANDDLEDSVFPEGDDDETTPCPHCLHPVYDDGEWCSRCGQYLSREDAPSRHPWWLVVGVLVCLMVVLSWVGR